MTPFPPIVHRHDRLLSIWEPWRNDSKLKHWPQRNSSLTKNVQMSARVSNISTAFLKQSLKGQTNRQSWLRFQPAAELGWWETEIMRDCSLKLQVCVLIIWLGARERFSCNSLEPCSVIGSGMVISPGAYRSTPGGARFQLPAGVNCGWQGDKTQGRLSIVYAACLWSASMQEACVCVCASLMTLLCSMGMLKPPTQRLRCNNTAFV